MRYLNATMFAIESHGTGKFKVKQTRAADWLKYVELDELSDASPTSFVWNRIWPTAFPGVPQVGVCRREQAYFGNETVHFVPDTAAMWQEMSDRITYKMPLQ